MSPASHLFRTGSYALLMRLIECTLMSDYYMGGFEETVPRKTAENTVKCQSGGVDSMIRNQRGDSGNSVTVTTLLRCFMFSVFYV